MCWEIKKPLICRNLQTFKCYNILYVFYYNRNKNNKVQQNDVTNITDYCKYYKLLIITNTLKISTIVSKLFFVIKYLMIIF